MLLWPTCWCVFLLGANSFGERLLSPLTSFTSSSHHLLLLWRHLDADLHRLHHLPELPPLGVVTKALQTPSSSSSSVVHLVVAAVGHRWRLALLLLVLDEEEDVAQREGHLALAAGQQVVVGVEAGGQRVGQAGVQRVGEQAQRVEGRRVRKQSAIWALDLRWRRDEQKTRVCLEVCSRCFHRCLNLNNRRQANTQNP